jgi:very-short-patch-repair endonuclease
MLLCMPPRFGGYGIALPELNRRIELTQREQLAVGVHHFDCDLYWPGSKVAVEYDSAQFHTASEKQERDAIRRNMLQYKGVHVITATRMQVNSAGRFDKLAAQIARKVGKRLRTPAKEHIAERSNLRKTVFDWDVLATPKGE